MEEGRATTSILVVEDDRMILSGLDYALGQEGYSVTCATGVEQARLLLGEKHFDVALLDMNLSDGTGFDVHAMLADVSRDTAVLFLTVVDDEGNVVRAFEQGAADYITKPFRLRELLARVKRVLKTRHADTVGESIPYGVGAEIESNTIARLGEVGVDITTGKAYVGDVLLDLTALEYRLLLLFATHKGQVLSRTQILESIWDAAGNFVEDNTLTVYIKRLREKLGDAARIETVRGMGYRAG